MRYTALYLPVWWWSAIDRFGTRTPVWCGRETRDGILMYVNILRVYGAIRVASDRHFRFIGFIHTLKWFVHDTHNRAETQSELSQSLVAKHFADFLTTAKMFVSLNSTSFPDVLTQCQIITVIQLSTFTFFTNNEITRRKNSHRLNFKSPQICGKKLTSSNFDTTNIFRKISEYYLLGKPLSSGLRVYKNK